MLANALEVEGGGEGFFLTGGGGGTSSSAPLSSPAHLPSLGCGHQQSMSVCESMRRETALAATAVRDPSTPACRWGAVFPYGFRVAWTCLRVATCAGRTVPRVGGRGPLEACGGGQRALPCPSATEPAAPTLLACAAARKRDPSPPSHTILVFFFTPVVEGDWVSHRAWVGPLSFRAAEKEASHCTGGPALLEGWMRTRRGALGVAGCGWRVRAGPPGQVRHAVHNSKRSANEPAQSPPARGPPQHRSARRALLTTQSRPNWAWGQMAGGGELAPI